MRFSRLELRAYGPFTNRTIDLTGGDDGLHVIYGPNEAGKSSALRAIRGLLYGIDGQTPDNFVHEYGQMRIAAAVRDGNEELLVVRRKGNRDTLLDAAERPIDEAVLGRFLTGVNEEQFIRFFGIDYDRLVSGADEMLRAEGDLGQLIFGASLGSSVLRILAEFGEEADALFRPRGKTQTINSALRRYDDVRRTVREASVPESRWRELGDGLRLRERRRDELRTRRDDLGRELRQHERFQRALPRLADLDRTRDKLDAHGDTVEAVVEAEPTIRALVRRIERYRSAREDLPKKQREREDLIRESAEILRSIRPDITTERANELRLSEEQLSKIRELASSYERITSNVAKAKRGREELTDDIGEADARLKSLSSARDGSPLQRAIEAAREHGDLDAQCQELKEKLDNGRADVNREALKLIDWKGSLAELDAMLPPGDDVVNRFADQFRAGTDGVLSAEARWSAFRYAVIGGALAVVAATALGLAGILSPPIAVPLGVLVVLATGLFALHARHRRQWTKGEYDRIRTEWERAWSRAGLTPGTPMEMRDWLSRRAEVLRRKRDADRMESELRGIEERIREHLDRLTGVFAGYDEHVERDESLRAVLRYGDGLLDRLRSESSARREQEEECSRLRRQHDRAESEHADATAQQEQWRTGWAEAIRPLDLDPDMPPDYVQTVMDRLEQARTTLRDASKISDDRIAPMTEEIEDYERIADKLRTLVPKSADARADDIVETLDSVLGDVKELRLEIDSIRDNLGTIGDGTSVDGFVAACREADPDDIAANIESLRAEHDDAESNLAEIDRQIGELRGEMNRIDGSDGAAAAAEEAASILGEMHRHVERYARLRLAERLLRDEIERYRAENQGPVLEQASELFGRLTLGSFSGLKAGYDDKDEPVLVGFRPTGEDVHVAGMSDGTRDQLYLALRIAALQNYLSRNQRMPFIVDDILIKFDDQRAGAALEILAELSDRTQVLFFTHHMRLREMAESIAQRSPDRVFIQQLEE